MPITLTYADTINKLASMLVIPVDNVSFVAAQPLIINDAEQRIYRELDLISTTSVDATSQTTAGNPLTVISTAWVVVDMVNLIYPAGTTNPNVGTRLSLLPMALEWLNLAYPSSLGTGVPRFYAMAGQSVVSLGPWPGAIYNLEVVGTQRPAPLSITNTTTFLSTYLPDLFFAACMVFGCGMQKNFGPMGDQPESAVTWEGHYQKLKDSAAVEELRKKHQTEGWSTKLPSPLATPPRT